MTEETEYQKLKRVIDEYRDDYRPSMQRLVAAAEKTLARMPQPVTGYVVAWVEQCRNAKSPVMRVSGVMDSRTLAENFRDGVAGRWTTSLVKIIEVTLDYTPPSRP